LLCIIPTLQVILHCIYYGNYPDPLPMAVYNEETDCFYNPCIYIGNCTYVSCDLLKMFDANKLQVVSFNIYNFFFIKTSNKINSDVLIEIL